MKNADLDMVSRASDGIVFSEDIANQSFRMLVLFSVAMTRARQRVVITHSLMSRTLHYSKDGSKKYVTCQVQPSRFLYELVPSKKKVDGILDYTESEDEPFLNDNAGTVWNRNAGVKEFVAGRNVPGEHS